jgi:uncharacterized protein DUF6894
MKPPSRRGSDSSPTTTGVQAASGASFVNTVARGNTRRTVLCDRLLMARPLQMLVTDVQSLMGAAKGSLSGTAAFGALVDMPRFHFNFRQDGSYTRDELGCEFETVEDAYLGALKGAQAIFHELLTEGDDPLACAFEVTDAKGNELFNLPFSEVLDAGRKRPRR